MRKNVIAGLLLAALVALPAAVAQETGAVGGANTAPKLVLSQDVWDFGMKWFGEPAAVEVELRNEGTAPLEIVQVRSSCGCTVARPKDHNSWNGMTIAPGAKEIMKLTYNTHKNKPKVSQKITIKSNDPDRPQVQLEVKGEIRQVYQFKPAQAITFTNIDRSTKTEQSITMTNNMEDEVQLKLRPLPDDAPFEVAIEPIKEGREYKLTAKTRTPLRTGSNRVAVILETGVEKMPTLTVPVTAFIRPDVSVSPPVLYIPPSSNREIQRRLTVQYKAESPMKITEVVSSLDAIKCEVLPLRQNNDPRIQNIRQQIKVTIPPELDLEDGLATITIKTDHPDKEYQQLIVRVQKTRTPAARSAAARQQMTGARRAVVPGKSTSNEMTGNAGKKKEEPKKEDADS